MKIDMAMFASVVGPYAIQLLAVLIAWLLGWLLKQLSEWLKFQLTQAQWKVIHSTAEAMAGRIWAAAGPAIATASITPSSSFVIEAANEAIKDIPDIAINLGFTPEKMAEEVSKLIASSLGAMQARATVQMSAPILAPLPGK